MNLEKLFLLAVGTLGGYALVKQNLKLAREKEELNNELARVYERYQLERDYTRMCNELCDQLEKVKGTK